MLLSVIMATYILLDLTQQKFSLKCTKPRDAALRIDRLRGHMKLMCHSRIGVAYRCYFNSNTVSELHIVEPGGRTVVRRAMSSIEELKSLEMSA